MDATMVKNLWQKMPGVETLTITPRNPVAANITNVKGSREKLNFSEVMWAASIGNNDLAVAYAIWDSTLGGYVPKQTDTLTDSAGVVWIIQRADRAPLGQIWRVTAYAKS